MSNREDITEALEAMVDKYGLTHVLTGLVLVCGEKASHLRHNWQDSASARAWDKSADVIETAARRAHN